MEVAAEEVWFQGWMWPSMCAWNTKSAIYLSLFCRHFLFKTSSGTTPLFSSSSPGYPLTSGTVYSPPPRLLPRNTFSRSAFKLKKPSKYCSWKCAALSAIAAAALLAILLSYFIGKISHSLVFGCSFSMFFIDCDVPFHTRHCNAGYYCIITFKNHLRDSYRHYNEHLDLYK